MGKYHDFGIKINYDNIERINIDGLVCPLFKINNLLISYPGNQKTKTFFNKNYLYLFDYYFYHQTIENNAQYDFIKELLPDINLIFLDIDSKTEKSFEDLKTKYPDEFFNAIKNDNIGFIYNKDMYEIYSKDVLDKTIYTAYPYNLLFEEVYLFTGHRGFLNDFIPGYSETVENFAYGQTTWWHPKGILNMRDRLLPLLKKDSKYPKNLYISRQDAHKRHTELLQKIIDAGQVEENEGAVDFFEKRSFDKEHIIENFFIEKGYTSVTFEGMDYLEQLNYIHNSENIATLIGSACINLFAASENTNFYEIHVNKKYHMNYHFVADLAKAKHIVVDLRPFIDDEARVIEELNNRYV